ncbi:MAG: hypothetical protein IT376_03575 [Polyangiaceae bacterium]|nr:hypothetical protein [Polyangiaceae bacterium]
MRRASARALALVFVAAIEVAGAPACQPQRPAESVVGKGQRYVAGDEQFDAFFESLHEVQVDLAAAPEQEQTVRAWLAEELGLEDDEATPSMIGRRLAKRIGALESAGTGLKLGYDEDDEDGDLTVSRSGAEPGGDDAEFVERLGKSAKSLARLVARMGQRAKEIAQLDSQLAGLDRALAERFNGVRRVEVRRNLADARQLLPLMAERAGTIRKSAAALLAALVEAAQTEVAAPAAGSPPPKKPGTPAPPKPAAPAPANPGPAPAPPKPPPPPPPGGGDFEP